MRCYVIYKQDENKCGYLTGLSKGSKYAFNFTFAKMYQSLNDVLYELGIGIKNANAVNAINAIKNKIDRDKQLTRKRKLLEISNTKLNIEDLVNSVDILNGSRIEILDIEEVGDISTIKNMGILPNKDIYNCIKKEADKFAEKNKLIFKNDIYLRVRNNPEKNATQEDVDDFCAICEAQHNKFRYGAGGR